MASLIVGWNPTLNLVSGREHLEEHSQTLRYLHEHRAGMMNAFVALLDAKYNAGRSAGHAACGNLT